MESNNTTVATNTTGGDGSNSCPKRAIYNEADLHAFLSSRTKDDLLKFILASGQSCASTDTWSMHDVNVEEDMDLDRILDAALSPGLAVWLGALRGMKEWLIELPPTTNVEMRFGNPAFRQWHARLVDRAPRIMATVLEHTKAHAPQDEDYNMDLLKDCEEQGRRAAAAVTSTEPESTSTTATTSVPPTGSSTRSHEVDNDDETVTELCAYLRDAFGHNIRLDYGTGHESSFQITLFALFQIGVFGNNQPNNNDNTSAPAAPPTKRRLGAATIQLWKAYLDVTRGLQKDYRLEPAGSHGVWGLDDYHCLSFYYGAQQLVPVAGSVPSDIYNSSRPSVTTTPTPQQDDKNKNHYLYFACIDFIRDELKSTAPFYETSPMLHDISGLSSWTKVAAGLYKLYLGEVVSKLPVVQHWVFGTHVPATWIPSQSHPAEAPTETLRTTPCTLPLTRAPWAT